MTNRASCVLQVQLRPQGGYGLSLPEPPDAATRQLLKHRLPCLQAFLGLAVAELAALGHGRARFAVQLHDEDPSPLCFRFDAPLTADGKGPLIPDPYVLGSDGYANLRQQFANEPLPPWEQRLPVAIWRGSSTGSRHLEPATLRANPRYQLCRRSLDLNRWLDARFTAVVQCPTAAIQTALEHHLHQQGLLTPRLSPWHLALHRWIVEIDGNVNSWGLLWKLLSGSCIVRVQSGRQQWYHQRLKAWQHVVPIAPDLSDLEAVLAWCQEHPLQCSDIAHAGQQLALEVIDRLEDDQRQAVRTYAANWLRTCSA
jgi:hypothetical protein